MKLVDIIERALDTAYMPQHDIFFNSVWQNTARYEMFNPPKYWVLFDRLEYKSDEFKRQTRAISL